MAPSLTVVIKRPHRSILHGQIQLKAMLLFLMLMTITFDYKRQIGDQNSFVVVLGLLTILSGLSLLLRLNRIQKNTLFVVLSALSFLVAAIFSGLFYGQSLYSLFSTAIPMVLFVVAILSISAYPDNSAELSQMTFIIIVMSIMAAVWKLFFGMFYTELTLSNVRYQIISSSIPLLFSYGLAGLVVVRRKFVIAAILLSVGVVLLSVTRSYIIIFFASSLVAIAGISFAKFRQLLPRVLVGCFAGIGILIVTSFFQPQVFDRWEVRLFASERVGFDRTAATRIAEMQYQIDRLNEKPSSLLHGYGLAAKTGYSGDSARMLQNAFGYDAAYAQGAGYGHNTYLGLVYTGGLFFGGLLVLAIFGCLFVGISRIRGTREHIKDLDFVFIKVWGTSALAGYIAGGMLGGNFGDRGTSIYQGIAIGLIFCTRKKKGLGKIF